MYATQLAPYFRLPSRMAISWSYDRSEFWLLWESDYPPFFILLKKTQLSVLRIYFLGSLYCSVILLPVILLLVIFPVIWCFPIWLTTSLSYPMAIFSANEIRTFFFVFLEKYCQNLSIIQNKQIWNMCIAFWWCNSIHNCPPGCSTYFIWWLERCRLAFMWLMMHNTIFE